MDSGRILAAAQNVLMNYAGVEFDPLTQTVSKIVSDFNISLELIEQIR